MPFIYSTLANDNIYRDYNTEGANRDTPVPVNSIRIKGGAGIASKNLITPLGVCTIVSDDDVKILKRNPDFCTHLANGFIQIRDDKVDVEVAAADMQSRDDSAPLVAEDFKETDSVKPTKKSNSLRNDLQ